MSQIKIADHEIGPDRPVFIIAEAGVNHNGDIELARQLIATAAQAGANAVKFQSFRSEKLVTRDARKALYQVGTTEKGQTQLEMLRQLELSPAAHEELIKECERRQIVFLSTPFEEESADLLADLGVPAFKLPSGELTNLPLLTHVSRKGKPILLSTGMANLGEVEAAVEAITNTGNRDLALLHCVSNYPAAFADSNLRAMATMATAFRLPIGYSDHTAGTEIALAAVALGACIIEKHFTIDRQLPGPDHQASLEPKELAALVAGIRAVEAALGDGIKRPMPCESDTRAVARKSLVAAVDLCQGTVLTEEMVAIRRPGTGIAPSMRQALIGREVKHSVSAGTVLTFELFAP